MKLRTKFLLFVIVLHAVALTLSWFVFRENRWIFLVSELLILASLWFSRSLYLQLLRPLKMLTQGAEALKDKDFSVRLLKTGQKEMDALIEVYNQMLDQLRHERTMQEQQHFFLEKLIHTSPTGMTSSSFVTPSDNRGTTTTTSRSPCRRANAIRLA